MISPPEAKEIERLERMIHQAALAQIASPHNWQQVQLWGADLATIARRLLEERDAALERLDIEAGLACVKAGHTHSLDDVRRIASLERERQEMIDAAAKIVENRYPKGTTPGDIRRGLAGFVKP